MDLDYLPSFFAISVKTPVSDRTIKTTELTVKVLAYTFGIHLTFTNRDFFMPDEIAEINSRLDGIKITNQEEIPLKLLLELSNTEQFPYNLSVSRTFNGEYTFSFVIKRNRKRKPMKSYDFHQFPLPASTNRRFLGTSPCVRPRLGSPQA